MVRTVRAASARRVSADAARSGMGTTSQYRTWPRLLRVRARLALAEPALVVVWLEVLAYERLEPAARSVGANDFYMKRFAGPTTIRLQRYSFVRLYRERFVVVRGIRRIIVIARLVADVPPPGLVTVIGRVVAVRQVSAFRNLGVAVQHDEHSPETPVRKANIACPGVASAYPPVCHAEGLAHRGVGGARRRRAAGGRRSRGSALAGQLRLTRTALNRNLSVGGLVHDLNGLTLDELLEFLAGGRSGRAVCHRSSRLAVSAVSPQSGNTAGVRSFGGQAGWGAQQHPTTRG